MTFRAINAGDLTHKVQIDVKSKTRSPSGAESIVWVPLRSVWAKVEPLNGKEYLSAQQIVSKIQSKALIRLVGNEDVNADMRMSFKGIIYNIEDVLPDERFASALTLMLSSFDVPSGGVPTPTPSPTPTPTPTPTPGPSPSPSPSPALVASASGQSQTYTAALASTAFDTAAGDLVVAVVTSSDTVPASSITDTAGNTFILAKTVQGTGDYNIATSVYYTLSSNAKIGNVATANFPGSEPHFSSLLVITFRGATWTYDAAGSHEVTHPYAPGPISSGALSTSGAGVLISAISKSETHSVGPTQSWAFSNGTLAIDEQFAVPSAAAAQINTGAVTGPFTVSGYNASGGNPTSNFNGNAVFVSFQAH
jgi:SPP1 family predicted phage head-tail adaptor